MPEQKNDQWVILELGPKAEGEDPENITASIRHMIRDAEVFIPASVTNMGEEKVVQYLVDGYAFIRRRHPDTTYFRLENSKYVQAVLRHMVQKEGVSVREVAFIDSKEIDKFRQQIQVEVDQGIGVGDTVLITSGSYKQIQAIVAEDIPERDSVQVHILLRSKEALITLPRACLRLVKKAPQSQYKGQIDSLKVWVRVADALMGWPEDGVNRVMIPYSEYLKLRQWAEKMAKCQEFSDTYKRHSRLLSKKTPEFETVRVKGGHLDLLGRGAELFSFFKLLYSYPSRPPVETKYLEVKYLQGVLDRLATLEVELGRIEKGLATKGKKKRA